jgi:tRNA (cytidine/uridine-2'-O-)-methyltransferase
LDYWPYVAVHQHPDVTAFFGSLPKARFHFFSKSAARIYWDLVFEPEDYLVFGSETEGLPAWLRNTYPARFASIPMFESRVRSLNLSSAVAAVTYEALRQLRPD